MLRRYPVSGVRLRIGDARGERFVAELRDGVGDAAAHAYVRDDLDAVVSVGTTRIRVAWRGTSAWWAQIALHHGDRGWDVVRDTRVDPRVLDATWSLSEMQHILGSL